MNFTKLMFVHIRSKNIRKLLLNTTMADFCRRQDNVLSFEELVLHSVVLELLELLEGLERPRAHDSMIRPRGLKKARCPMLTTARWGRSSLFVTCLSRHQRRRRNTIVCATSLLPPKDRLATPARPAAVLALVAASIARHQAAA